MRYRIERLQVVPLPLPSVAEFFENPHNLELITPPFLGFRILTDGPIEMREGALIDYRISLYGLPLHWRTRIDEYVKGRRFVDRQLKGPYKYWHHLHTFEEVEGGTEVRDVVDYELPFGNVGRLVHTTWVRRQLSMIFDYRRRVLEERMGKMGPSVAARRT